MFAAFSRAFSRMGRFKYLSKFTKILESPPKSVPDGGFRMLSLFDASAKMGMWDSKVRARSR